MSFDSIDWLNQSISINKLLLIIIDYIDCNQWLIFIDWYRRDYLSLYSTHHLNAAVNVNMVLWQNQIEQITQRYQILELINNSWQEHKGNHYREGGFDFYSFT